MKKILGVLTFGILFCSILHAQNSNAVFFSQNGERFFLIVNGLQQNDKAETNVKITGLNPTNYKVKILFENKSFGSIDKNIFLDEYQEFTFQIKKRPEAASNGEKYMLRAYSVTELPMTTLYKSNQNYNTNTTSTTINNAPNNGQVTISFNMGGGDYFGMNMNVNDQMYHETTTITTTTQNTPPPAPDHYVMQGYNGSIGCAWPMNERDFSDAKKSISSKTFEDSKMTLAKQIINTNCLFSSQVREIMLLFTFENSRLEFAKYAYGYTYDISNYYKVNDAFTFESSIDALNDYIARQ